MVGRQRDAIHNDTRQYIVCDTCVKKEREKKNRSCIMAEENHFDDDYKFSCRAW